MPDAEHQRHATPPAPDAPDAPDPAGRAPDGQPLALTSPLTEIPGIGPRLAEDLRTLGLTNLGRLIAHLPMRHERHEAESPIADLADGQIVSARGQITATRLAGRGRKQRFEAVLLDDTGRLDLVWFNAPYMRHKVHPGHRVRVQGTAKQRGPGLQIANPRLELIEDESEPAPADARLRPVYPASERVNSRTIERAMQAALPPALPLLEDHLPEPFLRERAMPALAEAYRMMHAPEDEEEIPRARRRLAYDELLLLQLGVHMKRAHLRRAMRAPALRHSEGIDAHIRERFPFPLTNAQNQVVREIATDLAQPTPANRLIQGDVGAGKTVVALYAMLMAVASEHQAALMAPTELLAEQHHASIAAMLQGSRVRIGLLTGATPKAERESLLRSLAEGELDILIGTHALLTESVRFRSLAVAVIDEQHRFGVHQRARLRTNATIAADSAGPDEDNKNAPKPAPAPASDSSNTGAGTTPHLLVMTATPIPRTLAMSVFGDLDVSTITGLPPGRRPIRTRVVAPETRPEVYAWVRQRLEAGEQAYIVVPAIDTGTEEDHADLRSVVASLESDALAGLRIAALHGRLTRETREHVMGRFRAGLIDALVATTVIEVGVDVPNATVMVVERADRFGLAQLHQLRGRVGRGDKPSACILIGDPQTTEATQRLEVMAATNDGFQLAEKDMEIRGPGEFFGTRQSGLPPFRVADLMRDRELLAMARRDAEAWIQASPDLALPEEALLLRRLRKAHGRMLGLGDVA